MKYKIILLGIVILLISTLSVIAFLIKKKNVKFLSKYLSLYSIMTKIPVIGGEISKIKTKLYENKYNSEENLRITALNYFFISWIISICFFLLVSMIYKETYMIIVLGCICFYLKMLIQEYLVGDDTESLKELIEFIKDLKHNFNLNDGSIDEALYEASKTSGGLIKVHVEEMYDAVENKRKNDAFARKCNNKYLKLISSYIYMTSEFGDKKVENKSIFINNMNKIYKDILRELKKRDKLKYWINILPTFSLMPMLFPSLLKKFALSDFPESAFFYESALDMIARIILVIICMTCFYVLKKFKDCTSYENNIEIKNSIKWEEKILKIKLIRSVNKIFIPRKNSKDYKLIIDLINESGCNLTMEWFYLRKFIFGILVGIITFFTIIGVQKSNINSTINGTNYKFINYESIMVSEKEQIDVIELDKKLFKEISLSSDKEEITKAIKKNGIKDEKEIKKITERIEKKIFYINNQDIKLTHILIVIFSILLGSIIPNISLCLKKRFRKTLMEAEVFQFYTIILLLMHQERSSIETILEWMEEFATIFKDPIRECRNDLDKGVKEALMELKKKSNFKPFERIVDNLCMCESISIKDSFESLEGDREFYEDERDELDERIVKSRILLSEKFGIAPTVALIALELVIPLLWACVIQFNGLYYQFV